MTSLPYERVVNFSIIERDFSEEKGELTPKGSFKRKIIEKNFDKLIKDLYKSNNITFDFKSFKIIIPRWFYRDLGILETDIKKTKNGLYNKAEKKHLKIKKEKNKNFYTVGDLTYKLKTPEINLGRLVRQPKLWAANPELINFSPCKTSYDTSFGNFAKQICLPPENKNIYTPEEISKIYLTDDYDLVFLNRLLSLTLHGNETNALQNIKQTENLFPGLRKKQSRNIRRTTRSPCLARINGQSGFEAYRIWLSERPGTGFWGIPGRVLNSGGNFFGRKRVKPVGKTIFLRQLGLLGKDWAFWEPLIGVAGEKPFKNSAFLTL